MVVGTAYSQREEKKETKSSNNFRLAIYLEHLLQFLRPPQKKWVDTVPCVMELYMAYPSRRISNTNNSSRRSCNASFRDAKVTFMVSREGSKIERLARKSRLEVPSVRPFIVLAYLIRTSCSVFRAGHPLVFWGYRRFDSI